MFTGWHPQCYCYVVDILCDDDEMDEYQGKRRNGENPVMRSRNEVTDMPEGFKQWMSDNSDKLAKSKSKPYFIRDNFSEEQIQNGDWEFDPSKSPWLEEMKQSEGEKLEELGNGVESQKGDSENKGLTKDNVNQGYVAWQGDINDAESLSKAIEEVSKGKNWFENGYQGVFESDIILKPNSNGYTNHRGDIYLRKDILDKVISGTNRLNMNMNVTREEAEAFATCWHEITHNRAKVGWQIGLKSDDATFYMETANEFVARNTLPEFYEAFGSKIQHPEFMRNRTSTAYNRRVRNYTKIIEKTGLDFDTVVDKVKGTLFNESYKYQLKGLKDALKGAKKADGTRLKATDVNTLMKYLNGGEQDYEALINMVIRSANTN